MPRPMRFPLGLAALVLSLALVPVVAATHGGRPPSFDCVGGYQADAVTNLCFPPASDVGELAELTEGESCLYIVGSFPGCYDRPGVEVHLPPLTGSVWFETTYTCHRIDHAPYCVAFLV